MSITVSCVALVLVSTATTANTVATTSTSGGEFRELLAEPPDKGPRSMWGLEVAIRQHAPLVDSSIFLAAGDNEAGRGQTFSGGFVWWLPGPDLELGAKVLGEVGGLRLAPWRAGDAHQPQPASGLGFALSARKTLMLTDWLWLSARPSLLGLSTSISSTGPCVATDEAGPVRCIPQVRQTASMGARGFSMSVELGLGAADASQRKEIFVALDYSVLNFSAPTVGAVGPEVLPELKMVPGGLMHAIGLSIGGHWSGVVSMVKSDKSSPSTNSNTLHDSTHDSKRPVRPAAND